MIVSFMFLLLLPLFVVGLILMWRGWRGVPDFGEPHCTKCAYDLRGLDFTSEQRVCPECGADLNRSGAVRFGGYRRRPRLIVVGGVLSAIPLLLVGLLILQAVLGIRWQDFRSNESFIANLATTADSPWDWRVLEARYADGRLSAAEVAAVIDQLIASLNATPSKQGKPLHWADRFLKSVMANGDISAEQLGRLCDAFYGTEPVVRMRRRVRQGKEIKFEIRHTSHWDLPGTKSVQALRAVRIGERPVEAKPRSGSRKINHLLSGEIHREIDGEFTVDLPPGRYEVVFELDWGLLDEAAQLGPRYDGRPGQADRWPRPHVTRKQAIRVPIEVVPPDAPTVDLVTAPALDPSKGGLISVAAIQVIPEGTRLSLRTEIQADQLPVPICVRMRTRIGDKDYDLGWYGRREGRTSSSPSRPADAMPVDVTSVTVVLEPDAKLAEDRMDMDRIWGKPIVIENVPLERYDLEESESRGP